MAWQGTAPPGPGGAPLAPLVLAYLAFENGAALAQPLTETAPGWSRPFPTGLQVFCLLVGALVLVQWQIRRWRMRPGSTRKSRVPQDRPASPHAVPAPRPGAAARFARVGLGILAAADVPEMLAVMPLEAITQVLCTVFAGDFAALVLFRHGTVVLLDSAAGDPAATGARLLEENGPVVDGTPLGDFGTLTLTLDRGWLVTCHHPKIFTYVTPSELGGRPRQDLEIGLIGRAKRHQDAMERHVVHVETASATA